ncbi:MAG: phospholipase D-like domain-containing protein [Gammaproteobacteria bacterium]
MTAPPTLPPEPVFIDAPLVAARPPPPRRTWRRIVLLTLLVVWAGTAVWETEKPLPPGTHTQAEWQVSSPSGVSFIADITSADAYGRAVMSQNIFDQILAVVRGAQRFLVIDYFLFNAHRGKAGGPVPTRALSSELRDALIERKRQKPDLRILFITDPINDVYGGDPSKDLQQMRDAGIDVVITNLDTLRDSNYLYSSFWRLALSWWSGDGSGKGWLPNPLDETSQDVTFGAWARLVNFKANHRKVIIGDDGGPGLVGIVASANPHDGSSSHSNVAVRIAGPALAPLLASEMEVARFSGWNGVIAVEPSRIAPAANDSTKLEAGQIVRTQVITEGAIRDTVVEHIQAAVRGESIDIAMFYISDRKVIDALVDAADRGVSIRLILDPNKDAFGHEKNGIPNRPVASELVAASNGAIHVRWYRTHGEQFHTKLVMVYGAERVWMSLGSANLTRRNIGDYNLEANVAIETARASPLGTQVLEYFDTLWANRAGLGIEYTADFGVYADPTQANYWLYRIMESTGLSTF